MVVFQTTFSVSLHVSGRAGSSGMTPAAGPRNCGHWSVAAPVSVSSVTPMTTIAARIICCSLLAAAVCSPNADESR